MNRCGLVPTLDSEDDACGKAHGGLKLCEGPEGGWALRNDTRVARGRWEGWSGPLEQSQRRHRGRKGQAMGMERAGGRAAPASSANGDHGGILGQEVTQEGTEAIWHSPKAMGDKRNEILNGASRKMGWRLVTRGNLVIPIAPCEGQRPGTVDTQCRMSHREGGFTSPSQPPGPLSAFCTQLTGHSLDL